MLFPEAHILVAGCGAGAEVKMLAKHYPKAHVVGLDFSEASIKVAERMAEHEKLANVTFEVVDLTKEDWPQKFDPFDFVLCHGVADYVSNLSSLLNQLTNMSR